MLEIIDPALKPIVRIGRFMESETAVREDEITTMMPEFVMSQQVHVIERERLMILVLGLNLVLPQQAHRMFERIAVNKDDQRWQILALLFPRTKRNPPLRRVNASDG